MSPRAKSTAVDVPGKHSENLFTLWGIHNRYFWTEVASLIGTFYIKSR